MSFRSILSNVWNNVQYKLFPQLEEDLGELSLELKKLVSILEFLRIEQFVPCTRFNQGRPCKHRIAIARAFIAKIVLKLPYTKQLRRDLIKDKKLRRICGWEFDYEIPSESKFSRAFKEFSNQQLPDRVHQALIKGMYENQMVGHVIKDSTPIEVREKAVNKGSAKIRKKKLNAERYRKKKAGIPNRRQEQLKETNIEKMIQDLPNLCDRGMKKSAQGYTMIWKGYKLHVAVDDNCIPLAVILTSASLNDCEAAIPLAAKANQVAKNFYDLMDSAYDHPEIKKHSISLGHVPVIDNSPINKAQKIQKEEEMNRKSILKFETAEDKRYADRFSKERFNALYKDYHGGRTILFRGHSKVFCHIMFGVLVLTASSLIKLL